MANVADVIAIARQEIGPQENPPGSNSTKYGIRANADGGGQPLFSAMKVSWMPLPM